MNPEVLVLDPRMTAKHALRELLAANVSGAPVVDREGRPIGVLSVRDLVSHRESFTVEECMNSPALVIRQDMPIHEAARLLAETGYHRLVVVDAEERLAGVVAPADVLRGLLGLPPQWPSTFPHFDRDTGLVWTDPLPLHLDRVEAAPKGPGVFVLIHGRAGAPERIVWAAASDDVRAHLIELLTDPSRAPDTLQPFLAERTLRFRAAATADPALQKRALEAIVRR